MELLQKDTAQHAFGPNWTRLQATLVMKQKAAVHAFPSGRELLQRRLENTVKFCNMFKVKIQRWTEPD